MENEKVKLAINLTNKLISDAVKNIQSNNDDYIIDYFTKLISSVKAKLEVTQFKDSKNSLKAEISIQPRFMSVLDSAIIFARRIIYLNLILKENTKYRIVPKPTPLPFSREMWQMFSKKWKLATMNKDESISLHTQTSFLNPCYEQWSVSDDAETIDVTDLLAVNTAGINWRLSLTKRPEDV